MRILLDSGLTLEIEIYGDDEIIISNCKDVNGNKLIPYFEYKWNDSNIIRFKEEK